MGEVGLAGLVMTLAWPVALSVTLKGPVGVLAGLAMTTVGTLCPVLKDKGYRGHQLPLWSIAKWHVLFPFLLPCPWVDPPSLMLVLVMELPWVSGPTVKM